MLKHRPPNIMALLVGEKLSHVNNSLVYIFEYLRLAYKDSDYTIVITILHRLKHVHFGAESYLCDRATNAFVLSSAAIVQAISIASSALTRGPQRF